MSDNIPGSLHNSDLFLNPEFTNTDKKKIGTNSVPNLFLKNGPSLGENNHLASLHSSYLLPPLHVSPYLNKAVSSYLFSKQGLGNRHRNEAVDKSNDHNGAKQSDKQGEPLLSSTGSTFDPALSPLRYQLRSGLTPRTRGQAKLRKDHVEIEPKLSEKTELLASNQPKAKPSFSPFGSKAHNRATKSLSDLFLNPLKRLNKGVSSSISREFLLVTTNLILFSVLAIVHKNDSSKSCALTDGNHSYARLFLSKMSNTTPSSFNAAGARKQVHPLKAGPVRGHVAGMFLARPETCACTTGTIDTAGKVVQACDAHKLLTNPHTKLSLTDSPKRSAGLVEHLVQPWHCIKSRHASSSGAMATRSLWGTDTNVNLYNDSQTWGAQYYVPFYKSRGSVLTESDTIPTKRDSVCLKRQRVLNSSRHLEPSSCKSEAVQKLRFCNARVTKQSFVQAVCKSVLTDLFYKHGMLLVSHPQQTSKAQVYKRFESAGFVAKSKKIDPGLHKNPEVVRVWERLAEPRAIETRPHVCFNTLKTTERGNPSLSSHEWGSKQDSWFNRFISSALKALLPTVSEHAFNRYSFALSKINTLDRGNTKPTNTLFPLGFAWSQRNLDKLTFAALVPSQNRVPVFSFMPDSFVRDSSVSGYQFPDLQDQEISYLFRKIAIFHFYFHKERGESSSFFQKLFAQITTPFRALKNSELISQAVSTPFLINENGGLSLQAMHQVSAKDLQERAAGAVGLGKRARLAQRDSLDDRFETLRKSNIKHVGGTIPSFEIDGIQMQYTQMDLDDVKNMSGLFNTLGRDYEEYLHQPKDSLPALIISPSLEDDREIEEEGIRIFRKRDFVKNKQTKLQEKKGEEHADSALFLLDTAPELSEKRSTYFGAASKGEIQNHQLLVKNALRQAQEEIDNIAKKEEKGTDKDKQAIPPLTRLEALYTVRNREKKHEQAKDFVLDKGTAPAPRSNKANVSSRVSKSSAYAKPKLGQKQGLEEGKPLARTHAQRLVLYSDKENGRGSSKGVHKESFGAESNCGFTPWLFLRFGDGTICTDRKHSFFGEMSLPAKRLTAQEQKQIFQQKANPLLKVSPKGTGLEQVDHCAFDLDSVSGTVSRSLLSQLSVLNKANDNKGLAYVRKNPTNAGGKGMQNLRFCVKVRRATDARTDARIRSKNRVCFYDTLSQNKACQGSAPKTKGTPLQSPVSHRVWQPKRMEPSTFRVSQRIKSTPVLPRITQKDWKNIMEWQLKKYFVEEDKRLLPLSLNTNKKLKIKKINLYLPWISIKKAVDPLTPRAGILPSEPFSAWPLTRCDLRNNRIEPAGARWLEPNSVERTSDTRPPYDLVDQFPDASYQPANYWRLPTQQNLYAAKLPVKTQATRPFVPTEQGGKQSFSLQMIGSRGTATRSDHRVATPTKKAGIYEKVCNESILFESVTRYSWLFVYTFFSVLIFKQLFTLVYKLGLKDFFVNFLNSDFGRTVTSEEFRYSIQNPPLTESYRPKKRLEELFGLERNKVQLLEIVWFLRNNCQGRHGVRGILLVGPPGVENVSVVQAIAGEANLPVVVQSLEKIAQDSEPQRKLEQLYMRAQKQAPCVLFLDQLDTVGARRDQLFTDSVRAHNGNPLISSTHGHANQVISGPPTQGTLNSHMSASVLNVSPEAHLFEGHGESNNTIGSNPFQKNQNSFFVEDQNGAPSNDLASTSSLPAKQNLVSPGSKLNVVLRLLTILDGVTQSGGVVTVATARDLTKLDPALLRPKRFDRKIYLSLPNQQDRVHLFKMHTQSIGHIKEMPWNYLSLQTESMSAADIRSAINYSLFRAVLQNSVHTVETLEYGISCVRTLTDKRAERDTD